VAGIGDVLVWAFLALAASSALLRLLHILGWGEALPFDRRRLSRLLVFAALADGLLIVALWEFLFLTSDLSYFYVWSHSSTEHELLWKVEGLWAGQEGSIFLWALAMTAALAINEFLSMRREAGGTAPKGSDPGRLADWTAFFASIVIVSFGIVLVASNWFRLTLEATELQPFNAAWVAAFPSGKGLSPTLRTELNAIHPPIELTGYALTVMPMAAAFAYLATGDKGWIRYCAFWTRIAWVFLTVGLALGGLWAYVTLDWGGYWAWDPVEVASLLPWIATTALLHAQIMHRRYSMYPLAAPLLAALAFSLTEFGTFVTRSGVWNSVHSFIAPGDGSIFGALAKALSSDIRLQVFFAMIFVPLGILVVLLSHFLKHHYKEAAFLPPRKPDEDLVDYLTQDKFTVFAGIFALCVILLMTFIILVKNAGVAPQPQEYETKLAFPLFVILFFMVVNYLRRPLGNENALLVGVVAGFAGAMAFILFPAPPSASYFKLAGFALPLVLAVFAMGALRIRGALKRGIPSSFKARARTLAVLSVHLGVAAVVLGYALTSVYAREERIILQEATPTQAGVTDEVFGFTFKLTNISKDGDAGASSTEHWDRFTARYEMYDASGGLVRTAQTFKVYERPTSEPSPVNFAFSNYKSAPLTRTDIYTTPARDVYIQISKLLPGTTNGSVAVELSVKEIPGIWGIWTGVLLMVGGMVTLMSVEYSGQKKGGEKFTPVDDPKGTPSQAPGPAPPKDAPVVEVNRPPAETGAGGK